MFSQRVCLKVFLFLVQRDIGGAEDLTITSEYGGNFFSPSLLSFRCHINFVEKMCVLLLF